MNADQVPEVTPHGDDGAPPPPACPECPIADAIERREREARTAAWAGVLVAVLCILSWNTWGFLMGAVGAIAFGLYARKFAPTHAWADFAAGAMLLAVLGLRLAEVL